METEEQQIEELKRWWQENGRAVIIGVVLGLGGISGWAAWNAHANSKAETLSIQYEQLVNTAAQTNHAEAVSLADAIIAEHPGSVYAGLAALVGAQSAYKNDDPATARRLLEWAEAHGDTLAVSDVARVRLARLLAESGEHAAGLAMLEKIDDGEFSALAKEARGDLLQAKGDLPGARAAYQAALEDSEILARARTRVQLKLDDLATRS